MNPVQLSESLAVTSTALEETKNSLVQKTLQCDEKEAQLKEAHEKMTKLEHRLERYECVQTIRKS